MIGVQAQGTWNAPEIPGSDLSGTVTGNYAIYNVKADAFMGEGMNYNTEAIACRAEGNITAALANRQKFTLSVSNGTVKMVHVNHTDRGVGCASANANDIYADYGSNNQWTFAASNTAPDYGNVYNLSIAGFGTLDVDDKWGGKLTTTGGPGNTDWAFIPEASITNGSFARWKEKKAMYDVYLALVASESTSTYADALSEANAVYVNNEADADQLRAATRALIIAAADGIQQPTNVSALFTNADIQSKGSVTDWSSDNIDFAGGAVENHWAVTAITLDQEKDDLPNGLYTLVFHGMYRTGAGDAPYFKAVSGDNNSQVNLPLMSEMASRWSVRGTDEWAGADNNKIPNKLWRAAEGLAYEGASAKIENFKVTGNSLNLTVKVTSSAQWVPFQGFEIYYLGPANLALYKQVVEKKAEAEGLVSTASNTGSANLLTNAIEEANSVGPSSTEDALNSALTALNTAITFAGDCVTPYAAFTTLKGKADNIAGVEYEETTSGSHSTFTTAISTLASTADNATNVSTITNATSELKAAIKTYINGAEPANESESFDITCLIINPDFANNDIEGWTRKIDQASGYNAVTNYNCNELWNCTFDFYQTMTELPEGSYSLSVQGFNRPGNNGNTSGGAYYDYYNGINNTTAELYVNKDASTVGNIYAYKNQTSKLSNNDFHCTGLGDDNYWVPNDMYGSSLFFENENVYKTTVAALVDETDGGELTIGFRDKSYTEAQWTIFTNFHLYYYGSSKLVYYQQYLPQLKEEASADLANGAYANVVGGSEDAAFRAALGESPAEETEEAYKAVIDNIVETQAAFRAAKSSYDALATAKTSAITKISENIGAGVFQYNETTNNTLFSAYEIVKGNIDGYVKTTSSTAAEVQGLVDEYNDAVDAYINQPLNAPDSEKHYNIIVATEGHAKNGNAIVMDRVANYPVYQGDYVSNNTGFTLNASATPNANYAQACVFTPVAGKANTYYITMERTEGTVYLTYGSLNDSKVNWKADQIQATTDGSKKGEFKIAATTTANQFNILNTVNNNPDNERIACQPSGNIYTANAAENAFNFTIAEASQAKPNLTVVAGVNWATFMSPFAVNLGDLNEVEAYKVESVDGTTVEMTAVNGTIDANTPVLLYRATTGSNYKPELSGWGTAASDTYVEGLFTGSYVIANIPVNSYALQKKENVVGFYKVTSEGIKVGANRAYLTVSDNPGAREVFFLEDDATGINTIGEKAATTLRDLLNGADVYDLSGRKVNGALEKNKVYIVNGNKIYVK